MMIQMVMKCKFCGEMVMSSDGPEADSPVIEFDFRAGEIRSLCKKCKKDNVIKLVAQDHKKLPGIIRGSY